MDRLWRIIEQEKIAVVYRNINTIRPSLYGLYLYDARVEKSYIILDKTLKNTRRMHKCVLAEEIGHYYTAPRTNYLIAYANLNEQIEMSLDERKAAQWATNFLIPDHELAMALKAGYRSYFELSEYFDVCEWFVYRKLGMLKLCLRRVLTSSPDSECCSMKLVLCICG